VVPSQTNFVLIKFPDARQSAKQVDQYLRNRGIYLRRFASPAFDDYIRITLGHRSNVDFAIDTIADFLDGIF
jgi:histidinol-phosphate/aromatic aminotransferase/cobyric acid decarboxylase-like protein